MRFSVLAALPNLVVDRGAALHLRRDSSVDCGVPELAHWPPSGEAFGSEHFTIGAPQFNDSPGFFSEARYSLTNVGTITLSIQLFTFGSSGLLRGETSFGALATLEQFRSLRVHSATGLREIAKRFLASLFEFRLYH